MKENFSVPTLRALIDLMIERLYIMENKWSEPTTSQRSYLASYKLHLQSRRENLARLTDTNYQPPTDSSDRITQILNSDIKKSGKVTELYKAGVTSVSEIAKLVGMNYSYAHTLIKKIK